MLAKKYRLGRIEIGLIKQQGQRFRHKYFLATTSSSTLPFGRFAVVVSTKVDKRATVRNRLRRLIYGALSPDNFAKRDIVLHLTPAVINLSHAEVASELHSFLSTLPSFS